MDDIPCNNISRSCLRAKNKGQRTGRLFTAFDLQLFVDDIQCVHLLSLVLMQTFDLNIENGIGI